MLIPGSQCVDLWGKSGAPKNVGSFLCLWDLTKGARKFWNRWIAKCSGWFDCT
jgi:hypothetical protein